MSRYGNMGVKRCVITSGMQTNAIKQRMNGFNGLKSKNTDFQKFSLYFLKGPVSGFVEHIPLPSLESRINRNH